MTEDLRGEVLRRLGRFPDRAPLELEMGGPQTATGHTRTPVSYQVEPGERVAAWLLRPAGEAPSGGWPGAVACHQHAGQFELGKSEPAGLAGDPAFQYGSELCRRGFVVLCPDHLCFEERGAPDALLAANPRLAGAGYEYFEFTRRLLLGSCLQTKYLHDLRCATDLLCGLPDVDASRLCTIGHSLGGQEALWLTFCDDRIRAGVSSCGFAPIRDILAAGIVHNAAMYVPGLLELGDLEDLVEGLLPRAFFLCAGEADGIFPVAGVRRLADRARAAYAAAGVPDRFRAEIFAAGHSFPEPVREAAYGFLERQLGIAS